MSWARVFASRIAGLLRMGRRNEELEEEVRFHLEMQIDDNLRAGMTEEEARTAAMRSFGGVTSMKETYRDRNSFAVLESTAQDLRFAARTLRKSPGYTLSAASVLALAIGANIAMFSVLDGVLLRPLPYAEPEGLAMLWSEDLPQQFRQGRSALWDVEQWRKLSKSFQELASFDSVATFLTAKDGVEQVSGVSVSPNLLSVLGVQPALGRGFSTEEVARGERVVLLSHRYWQTRFGATREVLGTKLVLNGMPSEVIGVLPADARLPLVAADIWEAHSSQQSVRGRPAWFVVGRFSPGIALTQAQAEMSGIAAQLREQMPEGTFERSRTRTIRVTPLREVVVGPQSRMGLWMLGGTVFCVLLIAAANVTSLSLARGVARGREMAVREALGASAGRIVRQLLTEGLLLACLAGAAGALLGFGGIEVIRLYGPNDLARLDEIAFDARAAWWALGMSLLAGLLVGLTPVFAALRGALRERQGSGRVSGGVSTQRVRRALVVADFALAILLLAGAGLLLRSWQNVQEIDPGFRAEGVLALEISAPRELSLAAKQEMYRKVTAAVHTLPGVQSAGLIGEFFVNNNREQVVTVDGERGRVTERMQFLGEEVSADFFATMGTPLRRGRFFTNADGVDAPRVAIVNEAMARRSWPEGDPIGKRFEVGGIWFQVAGVVADMRRQGLERELFPQMFLPLTQTTPPRNMDLFVRSSLQEPLQLAGALRAAVRGVEKDATVSEVSLLSTQFGIYLSQRRFQTALLLGFAGVALLMAVVGIYGLIQYTVATRTQRESRFSG